MLRQCKLSDPTALDEFETEREILCRVDHPNIIRILGAGRHPRQFMVLERVEDLSEHLQLDKRSLQMSLTRHRTFDYPTTLKVAKTLADTLHYLHYEVHPDATIMHRDLKPQNIGITSDGTLKLFDFGLSRCVKRRSYSTEAYLMSGETGSLCFMAPEVFRCAPYTEKVDVFSYAIVISTISRNKYPYVRYSSAEIRDKVVLGGERPHRDVSWTDDFYSLLEACWHEDSQFRPSFEEVSARLQDMMTSSAHNSHPSLSSTSWFTRSNSSCSDATTASITTNGSESMLTTPSDSCHPQMAVPAHHVSAAHVPRVHTH
jgi:serine/threonine protein kinase